MYKIISVFLIGCIFTTSAHFKFPLTLDENINKFVNNNETKINYTLPKTVIPKKYSLTIITYLEEESDKKFTFEGVVEIEIDIIQGVRDIVFHSKNLRFDRNDIKLKGEKNEIQEFSVKFDTSKDFVNITSLSGMFEKGAYILKINYDGTLDNDMRGFYKSSYVNAQGTKTWLGTTHFEPVGARRAFPCFDEPEYKAIFNLTIIHNKKYTPISNTKVNSAVSNGEKVTTNFYTTPPMPTYLLAFVVSDFANITNNYKNFSIFARSNAISHGSLALKLGEKLLNELEKFTGINYNLKKMDQAAIPDFVAGAMENWGLVLYREKSLLFDEKVLTTSEKQNIVETIAHEFAHQWFGNLVSPKWWKYLWLSEGFANFFQSYITEKVEPEWHSIDQSVVKNIQTVAFDFDSGSTTHPLNHNVESPNEISAIFDSISYQKGGAVIRMMQHFLTDQIFQKGLHNYLSKNSLASATSDNLITAIQEVVNNEKLNFDLKTIMDKWLNYKGYPAVYVTRYYDGPKIIEIKQERFFKYNASKEEKENKYQWYIPINYATEAKPDFEKTIPQDWLKSNSMNISIDINSNHWIIFNKQQTGYYRVNYDERNWKLITEYLKSKNRTKIHVLNRAQLINDALAFVQQEKLNVEILLHLTGSMKNETDYIAWYAGFKAFSWLKAKLINTEHYTVFKEYVLSTIRNLIESVGLEENQNDKHLIKLNRVTALDWACLFDDTTCRTKMNEKLKTWLSNSNNNNISPDFKQIVLCRGLHSADNDTWNKVLNKSVKTNNTNERKQFLTALGCSNNKDILRQYFNYFVEDNSPFNNTFTDISIAINSALENSDVGVDSALDFVIQRFITLLRKIKNEDNIAHLFSNIGEKITTEAQLEKLKETKKHDFPQNITDPAIELAESNIKWLQNNKNTLTKWTRDINSSSKSNSVRNNSGYLSLISLLVIITHFIVN